MDRAKQIVYIRIMLESSHRITCSRSSIIHHKSIDKEYHDKKISLIALTLASLWVANANASNPATQEYVQQYVQEQLASRPQGPIGATGSVGLTGPAGGNLGYADFFALMGGDNGAPINAGATVAFPQVGFISSGAVTTANYRNFTLVSAGVYQVIFQITPSAPASAQVDLWVDGVENFNTVTGRSTANTQCSQSVNCVLYFNSRLSSWRK
jgi:hypothetical protein